MTSARLYTRRSSHVMSARQSIPPYGMIPHPNATFGRRLHLRNSVRTACRRGLVAESPAPGHVHASGTGLVRSLWEYDRDPEGERGPLMAATVDGLMERVRAAHLLVSTAEEWTELNFGLLWACMAKDDELIDVL